MRIVVVRGRPGEFADELVAFWTGHRVLDERAARARVQEVVCVLQDDDGAVVGVNSVYAERVPLIANRQFWMYRRFAPGADDAAEAALINAAFEALAEESHSTTDGPVGLCIVVTDPETMRQHPDAVWPDTDMLYAGYTPQGHQVRIRYFEEASIL